MSYILEALQKAEAERKLGEVPGLLAQPAALLPTPPLAGATRRRTPALIALALLAVAGALTWFWLTRIPALPQASLPVSAPQSPPASAPIPALAQVPAAIPPDPAPQSVADEPAPMPETRQTASPRPAPQRATAPRPKPQPAPLPQASTTPHRPAPASRAAAQAGADLRVTPALAPEPGTASPQELPETIRRELPALAIGGYLYSENPRERQLLVNKRLLREGEEAAPGVTLETMLPKAAIFSYKGYRYRIAY